MNSTRRGVFRRTILLFLIAAWQCLSVHPASAQVSPNEILNPDLRALEAQYFSELKSINQSIAKTKFPFSFYVSRFVGLDPAQQAETDSRGLEFVRFQDRVVLKVTGNYNAAYATKQLTQNERATRTFHDVIVPILHLVAGTIPPDVNCDSIGFEISHHMRTRDISYDYEGKEILVVVLDRSDAFLLDQQTSDAERQEILNRSKIYINGAEFGLSLTERDPLNVQALARSVPSKIDASSTAGSATAMSRLNRVNPKLLPPPVQAGNSTVPGTEVSAGSAAVTPNLPRSSEAQPAPVPVTPEDAERLQAKFQAHLDALSKAGQTKYHFVDYDPPAFVVVGKQMVLQMTLRNSLHFEPDKSSIYKRAAQSFDLFLAPMLKDILEKVPEEAEFQALDFSVVNQLSPGAKGRSEAIEFICPRGLLRQFANAEITNQQLIDQSMVLVNGVRIALNLQLVE
jgi:hypothetical protein